LEIKDFLHTIALFKARTTNFGDHANVSLFQTLGYQSGRSTGPISQADKRFSMWLAEKAI
jgi:hypothetical protein